MLKKLFVWLLSLIVVLLVLAYVLLFTQFGNNLTKPYIQEQITKYSPIPLTLDKFELRFGSFNITLNSQDSILITSKGTFSLFTQNIDGALDIHLKNAQNIKELASFNLSKEILIENIIRGKIKDFEVHTSSNIADGELRIYTKITDFYLAGIDIDANNVQIAQILNILNNKPYASGLLNIKANIKGDSKLNLTGNADVEINNASVSKNLVEKDFEITIPATNFSVNLNADFNGESANHNFVFLSNIGNVESKGSTIISGLKTNTTYKIDINNLSPLTPLAGMPLYGSFRTDGKISGNDTWLNIEGKTDFASSSTNYSVILKQYKELQEVMLRIRGLNIKEVLYTLGQPLYANGSFDADMDLKSISSDVNGNYTHTLKGTTNSAVINKAFDMKIPNTINFNNKLNAVINKGKGLINTDFLTDVVNLNVKNAVLVLDNMSITAPYSVQIDDLKRLKFLTSKELKGKITLSGEAKYSKNNIYASFGSNIFGGKFSGEFNNGTIVANLQNMNSTGLLEMLQYPKFFSSSINGNLNYNSVLKNGNVSLVVANGAFTPNTLTSLLSKTLKFDATREIYNDITINGAIKNDKVNANLNMVSNNTNLSSKNAVIDLNKDSIDAYLLLKIQKRELGANVKGKMSSPSVSLDMKKLGTDAIKGVLENEKVKEQTKKLEEKAKEGLKKLFNR